MASVASIRGFCDALSDIAKSGGRHAWLEGSNLVVGSFPDVSHRYDFSTEQFILLHEVRDKPSKRVVSLLEKAGRVRSITRIEIPDTIYEVGSATQMLVEGLNIVERLRPGTTERLSLEKGRTKRHVARTREELYDRAHLSHLSTKLDNGFYVGTNNKAYEAVRVLKRAIKLAGLETEVRLHL